MTIAGGYSMELLAKVRQEKTSAFFILLVSLLLSWNVYHGVLRSKLTRGVVHRLRNGTYLFERAIYLSKIDRLVRQRFQTGNVYIYFDGIGSDPAERWMMLDLQARTAYNIYPRRVFVAKPGVRLNTAEDIIQHNFRPTRVWLQENDIQHVWVLSKREGKKPTVRFVLTQNWVDE